MRIVYKTYYRCSTQNDAIAGEFGDEILILSNGFTFNGQLQDDDSYTSAPAWFDVFNFFPPYSCAWLIAPPAEENITYRFSFTSSNKDGSETEYIVELVLLNYCSLDLGCNSTNLKMVTWLTREGGWYSFPFNGKTTFETRIPEGKTYIQTDYVKRYNSRPGVYKGEILTTGSIPEKALDLIESLKYSVQAYLVENWNETNAVYKPIMIDADDFTKRKTGDKIFDVTVRFIYAELVQIQSQ